MNLKNILHTTCPSCGLAFALHHDNIRQADFKRRFKKYDYLTKTGLDAALDGFSDLKSDISEDQEDEDETWCHFKCDHADHDTNEL